MEGNNGNLDKFLDNLVGAFGRVIAWGVMLIILVAIVTSIGIGMLRGVVKSAIDFTMASAVNYAKHGLLEDPKFNRKVKDNVKESVEYAFRKAKRELLQDEVFDRKVRENTKEAIEYALQKVKKEALCDAALNQKIKTNVKEGIEYTSQKLRK
ncbi:MAG: hypothetical protein KGJ87_00680 [Planctomycetota bacterium]|nr:hypothetical protein [Planctomycetota bacterium]MDE1889339.1 hypothetical protein [Planctomycetota bacterium]MDE2215670.1 hypothetical protein [Planctomycetota bacterium]